MVYKWDASRNPIKEVKIKGLTKECNSLIIDLDVIYLLDAILFPMTNLTNYVYMLEVKQEDIQGTTATAIRINKIEREITTEDVLFDGEFKY